MFNNFVKWLYEVTYSDWEYPYLNRSRVSELTEFIRRVDYWRRRLNR